MNSSTSTSEYMLLFRGPEWDKGLAAEELEQLMGRVTAWFENLERAGKVKAGQPLAGEGRTIHAAKRGAVADGPFAESKEAVGGYLILHADDLDEAVAVAKTCPTVPYGISIEVRPVLDECPVFKRVREQLAHAAA